MQAELSAVAAPENAWLLCAVTYVLLLWGVTAWLHRRRLCFRV
jgi:predicted acyltransferase